MSDRVRIGVVGCGVIAENSYIPHLLKIDQKAEFAAICDIDQARAKDYKDRFGAREVYFDYEEMLQTAPIDAVVVLTPISNHADLCLQALRSGRHVCTEKTLAPSAAKATEVIDEAAARNLVLVSAPAMAISPNIMRIKELIIGGAIGDVAWVRASHAHGGPANSLHWTTDPTWFYKPGAGPLPDLGVYALHSLTTLFGPATRLTGTSKIAIPKRTVRSGPAKGKVIDVEIDDLYLINLEWEGGPIASVDASFCVRAGETPGIEVYGSHGTISMKRGRQGVQVFVDDHKTNVSGWLPVSLSREGFSVAWAMEHMIDCIREGKKPILSGEHARHVIEIMEKTVESSRQGRRLELSTTFGSGQVQSQAV